MYAPERLYPDGTVLDYWTVEVDGHPTFTLHTSKDSAYGEAFAAQWAVRVIAERPNPRAVLRRLEYRYLHSNPAAFRDAVVVETIEFGGRG